MPRTELLPLQEVENVGQLRKLIATLDSGMPIRFAENPLAIFQTLEVGEMRNEGKHVLVFFGGPQ